MQRAIFGLSGTGSLGRGVAGHRAIQGHHRRVTQE